MGLIIRGGGNNLILILLLLKEKERCCGISTNIRSSTSSLCYTKPHPPSPSPSPKGEGAVFWNSYKHSIFHISLPLSPISYLLSTYYLLLTTYYLLLTTYSYLPFHYKEIFFSAIIFRMFSKPYRIRPKAVLMLQLVICAISLKLKSA